MPLLTKVNFFVDHFTKIRLLCIQLYIYSRERESKGDVLLV